MDDTKIDENDHGAEAARSPTNALKVRDVQIRHPEKIALFRRNIFPKNLVFSAADVREFYRIFEGCNESAKKYEVENSTLYEGQTLEELSEKIDRLMPVEYEYNNDQGDLIRGIGAPQVGDDSFPEGLKTFFASNESFISRISDDRPRNSVAAFISFEKPPLKMDLLTVPSNPTENSSVINISGREEDWVILTAEKINTFLRKKSVKRPLIHGSGTYDYFIYLIYIPVFIAFLFRFENSNFMQFISSKSIIMNIIVGVYIILFSLLLGRLIFQYVRWLFPPMEYYKKSRAGSYVHRAIGSTAIGGLLLSGMYDVIKSLLL